MHLNLLLFQFFFDKNFFDENSLWNELNLQKRELYVKKKKLHKTRRHRNRPSHQNSRPCKEYGNGVEPQQLSKRLDGDDRAGHPSPSGTASWKNTLTPPKHNDSVPK